MKIPPSAFFFCKHFGTGVLIATAFVHVSTLETSGRTPTDSSSFYLPHFNRSMTRLCPLSLPKSTLPCLV